MVWAPLHGASSTACRLGCWAGLNGHRLRLSWGTGTAAICGEDHPDVQYPAGFPGIQRPRRNGIDRRRESCRGHGGAKPGIGTLSVPLSRFECLLRAARGEVKNDRIESAMTSGRRRIVILRHGRTAWNVERRFQGRTELPLDEVGVRQADSAAERLMRLGPSIVLTSDAARANQTASPLASRTGTVPVLDPRLREADIGAWEGLTRKEVEERFPEEYAAWRHGIDIRRGGGETLVEVASRAGAAIHQALTQLAHGQMLVVVTHGGTAKATIGWLLGLPSAHWRSVGSLAHGRWAVLEETSFGWRLDEHNARPRDKDVAAGSGPTG